MESRGKGARRLMRGPELKIVCMRSFRIVDIMLDVGNTRKDMD